MIDVLIVGAGPTGLALALECVRYGLSCCIIDRGTGPSYYSKAIAIQSRTLEIFQRMGVHKRFLEEGVCIRGANIYSRHKKQARIDLSLIPSPFPFILSIEQNKTEQILLDDLTEQGVEIQRETTLLDFEEQDECVVAATNKGIISAHYLVGCDGSHSQVRRKIGCTFKGKTFDHIFSLADVHMEWEEPPDEISVFLESKGSVAAIPLPEKKRYRLIFQLERLRHTSQKIKEPHNSLETSVFPPPDLEEIHTLLSACIQRPFKISDPRWMTNFHINSRLASTYRKNHIFLAGDAAHIHSPVGGQGMNTGIQDAFNLAWKIAYVHLHHRDTKLLDTYEQERHTVGKSLLAATEKASRLVTLNSPLLLSMRNFFLSHLLSSCWVQKRLVLALAELNLGYPEYRVPNYTIIQNEGEYDYFSFSERAVHYHLLYNGPIKPSIRCPHVQPLQIKEKIPFPILVRPDGYPASRS